MAPPIATPPIARGEDPAPPNLLPQLTQNVTGISADNSSDTGGKADNDVVAPINSLTVPAPQSQQRRERRLSFRSFAFFYGRDKAPSSDNPATPTRDNETAKHKSSFPKHKLSRSEKEARSSAVALRALIIGPGALPPTAESRHSKPISTPDLKKVKSQLLKPKSANAIITQLRVLPLPDGPSFRVSGRPSSESLVTHPDAGGAPIHAVCLAYTDEEADRRYFSRLRTGHNQNPSSPITPNALSTTSASETASIITASLESLLPILKDLRLVSLLASPDLGFGQPVSDSDESGPLTGSVPSAMTVMEGFEEITKQLMMLGFATSKAVFPDHTGIYSPTDRMSVLTYWWGLELVLPEPSVVYLGKAKSISNTLLNFLSAFAMFNNGVREVLPFIRYVANFVDFEWSAIKAQDKGRGVVCAATWVMPAAMVPRSWDFPSRPATAPNRPTPADTTAPKTSSGGGTVHPSPPQSNPTPPPDVLYPAAPIMPMMPQLMVTPATLPRSSSVPQEPVT
ncbi:hypothetical protein K439DRAFT_1532150 [Ramaria rubella]|nr:hypothetical protein K439DRAFT_1532150 [Ramaria rubella]